MVTKEWTHNYKKKGMQLFVYFVPKESPQDLTSKIGQPTPLTV